MFLSISPLRSSPCSFPDPNKVLFFGLTSLGPLLSSPDTDFIHIHGFNCKNFQYVMSLKSPSLHQHWLEVTPEYNAIYWTFSTKYSRKISPHLNLISSPTKTGSSKWSHFCPILNPVVSMKLQGPRVTGVEAERDPWKNLYSLSLILWTPRSISNPNLRTNGLAYFVNN